MVSQYFIHQYTQIDSDRTVWFWEL